MTMPESTRNIAEIIAKVLPHPCAIFGTVTGSVALHTVPVEKWRNLRTKRCGFSGKTLSIYVRFGFESSWRRGRKREKAKVRRVMVAETSIDARPVCSSIFHTM